MQQLQTRFAQEVSTFETGLGEEHGRWRGPARIIALEGAKVVWLSHLGRLVRANPEQLGKVPKNAEGDEQMKGLKETLKMGSNYVDLDGELPPNMEEMEEPESLGDGEPESEATP